MNPLSAPLSSKWSSASSALGETGFAPAKKTYAPSKSAVDTDSARIDIIPAYPSRLKTVDEAMRLRAFYWKLGQKCMSSKQSQRVEMINSTFTSRDGIPVCWLGGVVDGARFDKEGNLKAICVVGVKANTPNETVHVCHHLWLFVDKMFISPEVKFEKFYGLDDDILTISLGDSLTFYATMEVYNTGKNKRIGIDYWTPAKSTLVYLLMNSSVCTVPRHLRGGARLIGFRGSVEVEGGTASEFDVITKQEYDELVEQLKSLPTPLDTGDVYYHKGNISSFSKKAYGMASAGYESDFCHL